MSNYANNMPPSATAGAHMGMMPSYGMPNAEAATNAWANNAPPAYTSPASFHPHTMGYSPMHCGPMKPPVIAAAAVCGGGSNTTASILVLFILLVIISRAFVL